MGGNANRSKHLAHNIMEMPLMTIHTRYFVSAMCHAPQSVSIASCMHCRDTRYKATQVIQ